MTLTTLTPAFLLVGLCIQFCYVSLMETLLQPRFHFRLHRLATAAVLAVLIILPGLRLPSICLRQSEDGTLGVYCAQGGLPQFKPVNMVYQGDDYVLVSVPTGTGDRSILRPGDEVLMTGVTLDGTQILTGD